MTQKVIKVGDSAAVVIPKRILKKLDFKVGDDVKIEVDDEEKRVLIEPAVDVNEELVEWTDNFIKEYRSVLKKLAEE